MKLDIHCVVHPKYQAKAYPRSGCDACRILYRLLKDGQAVVDYADNRGFSFLETKERKDQKEK